MTWSWIQTSTVITITSGSTLRWAACAWAPTTASTSSTVRSQTASSTMVRPIFSESSGSSFKPKARLCICARGFQACSRWCTRCRRPSAAGLVGSEQEQTSLITSRFIFAESFWFWCWLSAFLLGTDFVWILWNGLERSNYITDLECISNCVI